MLGQITARGVLHGDAQLPLPNEGTVTAYRCGCAQAGQNVDLALGELLVSSKHMRQARACAQSASRPVASSSSIVRGCHSQAAGPSPSHFPVNMSWSNGFRFSRMLSFSRKSLDVA